MNSYITYDFAINKDFFVLAIQKSDAIEFMICNYTSNVRYWVRTLVLPEYTHPEEIISTEIKENYADWIDIWNNRCNGEMRIFDD